ncbi:MAG: acyl-CoA dehydrogenase family protein [Proteobacteria bacterium]|nr:acyl-CoA dehydrogenase family protein [Pseudomonadota bacterium]
MDLGYSEAYEAFRGEVQSFLASAWPLAGDEARLSTAEQHALFRRRAIEAGYLARRIPRRYGGSEQEPDVLKATIIREEFRAAGAPGDVTGIGPSMLVPTLLERGEEWQKERFVARTMTGEFGWCQGYSEPGAGSDLASVRTRAELVGDRWVVNGQKVWTSGAQTADFMFCLCRTEPEASKHAGISYLLLDMNQPGIEVRPLRQITGESHFNEVFLNDAETPADWIVGARGEGWSVSRSTLKHERNSIGSAEQAVLFFDGLVKLARNARRGGRPALEDPAIRQRLVEVEGLVRAHEYSGYKQLTASARGRDPGIIQLMNKQLTTRINHALSKLALDLADDHALLAPAEWVRNLPPTEAGVWMAIFLESLGGAIAGGTSNIQRNIIAERGLGLPRDRAAQRA